MEKNTIWAIVLSTIVVIASFLLQPIIFGPQIEAAMQQQEIAAQEQKEKAETKAMPIVVCMYEGGGYSEAKENRKKSALQHKEISNRYLGKKALRYRLIMMLTLSGLRSKIAESPVLSGPYNALKTLIYKIK